MGWTADVLLGLSSYAWRVKHNVAHHTYTNVDGYDADITQVPLARLVRDSFPAPGTGSALLHLGVVLRDGAPLADSAMSPLFLAGASGRARCACLAVGISPVSWAGR